MTTPQFPKVNGQHASWANFRIKIHGTDVEFETEDIQAIDGIKDSVEPGEVYGAGGHLRGDTEGQYKPPEITLSLYLDAAMRFQKALAAVRPDGKITLVYFNVSGSWAPYADTDELHDFELTNCRVKERAVKTPNNTDAHSIDFPLMPRRLFLDGVCLIGKE